VLNLSRCKIGDEGAKHIGTLIQTTQIRDLNIHWNQIRAQGCTYIAEGLKNTCSLRKLDMAWNSLGSINGTHFKEGEIGDILGEALTVDCLRHLDISYNKFTKVDCLAIGEKLKDN
jgi:hypothetical protein